MLIETKVNLIDPDTGVNQKARVFINPQHVQARCQSSNSLYIWKI